MTSTPCHSGYRDDRTSHVYFGMCLSQCACASFHFVSFIHACVVFRWPNVSKGDWNCSRGPKKDRWVYTVWSRILLEKLAVRQLVKKLSHFTELDCSSPCSQETAICQCSVTSTRDICIKTTPETEFNVTYTLLLPYCYLTATLLLQLQYLISLHSWQHSYRNTRWRYCVNLPAYLRNIFSPFPVLLFFYPDDGSSRFLWIIGTRRHIREGSILYSYCREKLKWQKI